MAIVKATGEIAKSVLSKKITKVVLAAIAGFAASNLTEKALDAVTKVADVVQ